MVEKNGIGFVLHKQKDKDFVVLNLSGPQMHPREYKDGQPALAILKKTVDTLIERCKPDLITLSGDMWDFPDTMCFANIIDSYGIPWAFVYGNEDVNVFNLEVLTECYQKFQHCIFDIGSVAGSYGNYVICIEEEGKILSSLIMMDTHNVCAYDGIDVLCLAKWYPAQFTWYKQMVQALKDGGCKQSVLIQHSPFYAYKLASKTARKISNLSAQTTEIFLNDPTKSADECYWNDGYKGTCFGVELQEVDCPPEDDGVFDLIQKLNHTKNVLTGHNTLNNTSILYEGVRLTCSLHTGKGRRYSIKRKDYNGALNGGTTLTIGKDGQVTIKHEYVKIDE